jgi:DNA-binding IclR family transcriptional regulator
VQTIERIVAIIEKVAQSPDGVTLTEIARASGLSITTCHRALLALTATHLLERDANSKRYRTGVGLLRLAASVSPSAGFSASVATALSALRDRWQECCYLAVLMDGEVVCVESVSPTQPYRMGVYLPRGRRLAPHASAGARAILAHLPPQDAAQVMSTGGYRSYTEFTRTTPDDIHAELVATRTRGYAVCDQELEIGVTAFSAPIRDVSGSVTRSLGVIGPRERLRLAADSGLLTDLVASARYLSGLAPSEERLLASP